MQAAPGGRAWPGPWTGRRAELPALLCLSVPPSIPRAPIAPVWLTGCLSGWGELAKTLLGLPCRAPAGADKVLGALLGAEQGCGALQRYLPMGSVPSPARQMHPGG